ncbi:thioredoxin fold domain-containing protein [Aquimarina sp. TRL1]|nr:thioredoxin fold domain-containing protein [Aquimarina sp. TRL1]
MSLFKKHSITGILYLLPLLIFSQKHEEIHWITFEQLDDSLKVKSKKVFIDFYTDWCVYCKKMDRVVFTKPEVIAKINKEYYAVKMNAEQKDTISFDGTNFINKHHKTKRNAIHDIPLLLASRKGYPFSLPAMVILDENFSVKKRFFEYLDSKKLLNAL